MKGLLIQEFKTLFKSPAALSILIIPVVLMIGLGYLLPSGWIVPSAITIGIVGSVLLYFGGSLEEIKRTSFMKSISLTKLNKFTFLSTKILFSVFVSLFSVLWVLFFAWMFTEIVPFLAINFSHILPPSSPSIVDIPSAIAGLLDENAEVGTAMDIVAFIPFMIQWDNIDWLLMLYAGAVTIMVSIAIAFLFVTFSKSSLSFYLMSFGYLLAMILFGGVVMPSFLVANDWFEYLYYIVPNFYTNNVMAGAFGSGLGATIEGATGVIDNLADNGIHIPAIEGATAADDVVISNMIDSLDGSWSIDSINAAWAGIDEADKTDYVIFINNILHLPAVLNLDSWKELVGTILGKEGAVLTAAWKVAKPILSGLLENHDSVAGLIDFLNSVVFSPENQDAIHKLTATLNGMFNTASLVDYIVPWIETIVFLGIATKYFRWS